MGKTKHFVAFSMTHLECLFHLKHINLKGWPYNWHGYHAAYWYVHPSLIFGMNFMSFQHLNCLDLILHLDLEDAFISSCIYYLQLHRKPKNQGSLMSRQDHDGIMLNWKQFMRTNKRRTRCKYFFKRKNG